VIASFIDAQIARLQGLGAHITSTLTAGDEVVLYFEVDLGRVMEEESDVRMEDAMVTVC